MRIILLLLLLFLQSCFIFKGEIKNKTLNSNDLFHNSENEIELTYNECNGVYHPTYMNQNEVLDYIEYFKKDESDSVHYRLGYINNWWCYSSDKVQCDTLRFFVQKLIPYPVTLKNKTTIIDSTDIWYVDMEKIYYKAKNDSIVFEKNLEANDDRNLFLIRNVVHKTYPAELFFH
jgi:hypothetical protein